MGSPDLTNRVGGSAFLSTLAVTGATSTVYTELNDYTSPELAATYYANMSVIQSFFNRVQTTPANLNIATDITAQDATDIQQAIAALLALAQNGLVSNSTAGTGTTTNSTFFMTKPMASNLDLLIRSFQAVGAPNPQSSLSVIELAKWKDLATTSPAIQSLMQAILYAVAGNRSIQSIIELEYVATGNDLVNAQLSSLETALNVTQNVLNSLANLQNIRNSLVIPPSEVYHAPTDIPFLNGDVAGARESTLMKIYRSGSVLYSIVGASNFFTSPIFPVVASEILNPTNQLLTNFGQTKFNELLAIQRSLLAFVPILQGITDTKTKENTDSLLGRIQAVLHDFSTMFINNGVQAANLTTLASKSSALRLFLLDNNDPDFKVEGRTPNDGQSNLTFALTAAQGLNDQQKQLVQQYLYIFQQFYQSASAVLQAINQMITRMAQNIGR